MRTDYKYGTRRIAVKLGVTPSDVSNMASGDKAKIAKVAKSKRGVIIAELERSKAEKALDHLKTGGTLTPLESLSWFGLHALSQQVTKWRRRGIDVRNIVPEAEKFQTHGVYALFINGERITGEQK